MTNSMTLQPILSNNYNELELALLSFLEGRISLFQLQKMSRDYLVINFDLAPNQRYIQNESLPETIRIPVEKRHLRYMLQRYVAKGISEAELSNWAAFIFMSGAFVPEGDTEEERWQSGDGPVWDILQRLMTPSVFDSLNITIAKHYLELLD